MAFKRLKTILTLSKYTRERPLIAWVDFHHTPNETMDFIHAKEENEAHDQPLEQTSPKSMFSSRPCMFGSCRILKASYYITH